MKVSVEDLNKLNRLALVAKEDRAVIKLKLTGLVDALLNETNLHRRRRTVQRRAKQVKDR
jgi:hypothetical protein